MTSEMSKDEVLRRHERVAMVSHWIAHGQIRFTPDTSFTRNSKAISVTVGTERIEEGDVENFPSEGFTARCALAIAAGQADPAHPDYGLYTHVHDAMKYKTVMKYQSEEGFPSWLK